MLDAPNDALSVFTWIQITAPPGVELTTRVQFVDATVNAPKPGIVRAQIFEGAVDP